MIKKKLTAIIACYNDQEAIPEMHSRLVSTFKKINCNYEIIFVDDGSPDNSKEIIRNISKSDTNVYGIVHSRNFSSQNAFTSGMLKSSGDAVILLDGDLQDPPEIIEKFYNKWAEGYDVVYGVRNKREANFLMNFFYKLFYKIFKKISNIDIPLDAGDFSLIDKKVVKEINSMPESDRFIRGLRAWVGFKQTGINYFRPERKYGKTTNNFFKNLKWAKKGIFSFSFIPLEAISLLSYFIAFISAIAIIWYVGFYFIYPGAPAGITTILVLILFLGSIQLLSNSILSEYISKILEEGKNRPKFIIKELINFKE